MRTSDKVGAIAAALYAVHRDLTNPKKDAKGQVRGRSDYRYTSLPALIDHAKKQLREAQVAVIQDTHGGEGNLVGISTMLMHLTGEYVETDTLWVPFDGTAQGEGSAITYGRRYQLAAVLNIAADDDDDGEGSDGSRKGKARASDGAAVGESPRGESDPTAAPPPDDDGTPSTDDQWELLLEVSGLSEQRALNRLNIATHKAYTKKNMREATHAEVSRAITGMKGD